MQASQIPVKFPIPWGSSAGSSYIRTIPVNSQIGSNPGFASLTDGFVPLNMTPVASGGIPPFGQDLNGILRQVTQWDQWQQAGGAVSYDASFSASIGGYPQGALLQAATGPGAYWVSLADNNTTNPDAGGDNWAALGNATTGDVKWRPTSEVLPGWVKANATTIGNAASGASQLAAQAALNLFTWHWTNFSNTQCPVSGGRGASAAADFNANKTITVLDMRGYGATGMDTMGGAATSRLTGVPATSGNATTAGSLLGENLHPLVAGENGPHTHTYVDPTHTHSLPAEPGAVAAGGTQGAMVTNAGSNTGAALINITINSQGSGTGHNTLSSSLVGTWYLKL